MADNWRDWINNNALPVQMEATGVTAPTATGFQPGTVGSISFRGDRSPDDPTVLLDGKPLVRFTSLRPRATDLFGTIPTYEQVQEARLAKLGHANRISDLVKPRGEGGFGLDPSSAPQVR
jgi:hypothetical protein